LKEERLPPHYRWNFTAFLVDYVCFGAFFTFFNPSSILPAFVRQLTDAAPLVGLTGTIFRGGFQLPQLLFARIVHNKVPQKPYMLMGTAGRLMLWVLALSIWAGLTRYPGPMLALFFTAFSIFAALDGLVTVVWFDIMAQAIPPTRRGRLIGAAQVIGGLAGIGVGALVALILSNPRLEFPDNYALLFTLGGIGLIPSTIALALIRELLPTAPNTDSDTQGRLRWLDTLGTDRVFRRLILCRILTGMVDLAIPFYVGHAEDVLHLPAGIIGGFVIAQTAGSIVASALLSPVSERWGPSHIIRIATVTAMLGPLFALLAHLTRNPWLVRGYPFIYATLGALNSTWMLGFIDYTLHIAPEGMRPAYIGLSNTILGAMMIVPPLGGWLLEATSYTVLFGLALVLAAGGFVVALRLGPVRSPGASEDPA
jgi:MFS family permease